MGPETHTVMHNGVMFRTVARKSSIGGALRFFRGT